MSGSTIGAVLRDGPRVLAVELIAPGGVVLRIASALAAGQWSSLELRHPSFPAPLAVSARVAWCRAAPDGSISAGLELHGTWEGLSRVRRALLSVVASRVLDGDRFLGWVLRDPETGSWTVHSVHSVKLAVLSRDGERLVLKQRDGAASEVRAPGEGLALVFGLPRAPRLDPPLPNVEAPSSPSDSSLPEEEAVFGANTVVVPPERADVALGDIFAARTVNLGPGSGDSSCEDLVDGDATSIAPPGTLPRSNSKADPGSSSRLSRIKRQKGSSAVIQPPREGKHKAYSKILAGNETVGWIAPAGEDSWSVFDPSGSKLAVLLRPPGTTLARLCWFGDTADESLEFLEAATCLEALAVAFELPASPRIDPRLPGLS